MLVEVARALRASERPAGAREVRFVLFDGVEETPGADADFYAVLLRGSKTYAQANARCIRTMVLLDYPGNGRAAAPARGTSDPWLCH